MGGNEVENIEDELMAWFEKSMPDYMSKRGTGALERNIFNAGKQNRIERMKQYLLASEQREIRTEEAKNRKDNLDVEYRLLAVQQQEYWNIFREELFKAKNILVKRVKTQMSVKRLIVHIQLRNFVERLKLYWGFCFAKRRRMQASLFLALKLYGWWGRRSKSLGSTTKIRDTKRYFHFRLPLANMIYGPIYE